MINVIRIVLFTVTWQYHNRVYRLGKWVEEHGVKKTFTLRLRIPY